MAGFDYVILAILLISSLIGMMRGFLREVCSLVTLVLAVWLGWRWGAGLEPLMGGMLREHGYSLWAGRIVVFVLIVIAGGVGGAVISHFTRLSLFRSTDRFLGFLLGLARGFVLLGAVALLAKVFHLDNEQWWTQSMLARQLGPVAKMVQVITGETIDTLTRQPD
ncbi:MAG: CvpA family protein [Nevskiaceae bacterium]|jgi:membrane protein required for colicin V production|nr:CvpA family protein [Nevskiaceae bacterium]